MCDLRDRFLSRVLLESIEVKELINPSQHFCPNRYMLIRKNNRSNLDQQRYSNFNRDSTILKRCKSLTMLIPGESDEIMDRSRGLLH